MTTKTEKKVTPKKSTAKKETVKKDAPKKAPAKKEVVKKVAPKKSAPKKETKAIEPEIVDPVDTEIPKENPPADTPPPKTEEALDDIMIPVVARKLWDNDALTLTGIPNKGLSLVERSQAVREAAITSKVMTDRLGLVQGELLYEIAKRNYWRDWGFDCFNDYIEKELEFKRRKAYYLIQIYEKFVVELGLPIEVLKDLEWSKAKELLPVLTIDNWEAWLKKIEDKTVVEINAMVKAAQGKAPVTDFTKRMTFSLTEDQHKNIETALALASKISGSEKPCHLLDLVATDFIAGALVKEGAEPVDALLDRADLHIKNIERAFGITLKIEKTDAETIPAFAEEKK